MKKGDIVLVRATVVTKELGHYMVYPSNRKEVVYDPDPTNRMSGEKRPLLRISYDTPIPALVIGKSTRIAGMYYAGYGDEWFGGDLRDPKVFKVWMVEPLNNQRWIVPYAALEEDLSWADREEILGIDELHYTE